MALFGRDRRPSRATLSRFLAALDQPAVESLRTLLSPRSAGSSAGKRGTVRWDVRPAREPLPRLRCGWHAPGSEPSRPAKNGGSACSSATFASTVCPRLHRAQTRGSRALAHHGLTGAYASVDCDVWKRWLRLVPCRTASSRHGHTKLSPGTSPSPGAYTPAPRRTIWDGSCPRRFGRAAVCDARERLSTCKASRGPGSPETAPPIST